MVELHIQKNQGITSAIKTELIRQGHKTDKMTGSVWSAVMKEVSNQNTQNIQQGKKAIYTGGSELYGDSHKNFVVQEGIIEIAQNIWNKIVSIVTGKSQSNNIASTTQEADEISTSGSSILVAGTADVEKIKSVSDTRTVDNAQPTAEKRQNVERARDYLSNQLKTLDEADLKQIGISVEKRDRILEYLKNITWDSDHNSAQAKGAGIVFSTACEDTDNLANMVTLLMHEANHCDENYLKEHPEDSLPNDFRHRDGEGNPVKKRNVNTKEEERACETLGLLTTAMLIKKGVLTGCDDYGRYGEPQTPVVKYLEDKALLKRDIDSWLRNGYTNYPEGVNDASITIEHCTHDEIALSEASKKHTPIQLKAGDIIKIGDQSYTLGGPNGIVLSAFDSIPVFQMVREGNVDNGVEGILTFNELPPDDAELAHWSNQNGKRKCLPDNQPVEFVVIRAGVQVASGFKY